MARLSSLLYVSLFLVPYVAAIESVSIRSDLLEVGHTCISKCLYSTYLTDIGAALNCGTPYDNNCYCATASESVSAADSFMSRCASKSCKAGDLSIDLTSMQSLYGSYCYAAGFSQAGAEAWFSPAERTSDAPKATDTAKPSQTANSPQTTTQLTIVTQTTEGDSGATRPQVTVQATSTLWVNPDGSPAKLSSSDSGTSSAVKIGVGVAVPVVAILAFAIGFLLWRRRRRNQSAASSQPPAYTPPVETAQVPPPMSHPSVSRKPIASPAVSSVSPVSQSQTNELSDTGVHRELSGQEVHKLPNPSPPIALPGQHEVQGDTNHHPEMAADVNPRTEMDGQGRVEVSGESRPPELPGQSQSPPPQYGAHVVPGENQPRWELPDNSR